MTDDYIQQLTDQEKTTFVRALIFLIKADGVVDDRERSYIHEAVDIYGVNMSAINTPMTEEIILSEITNNIKERAKALFLIRELLTMAHIDDDLSDDEISFIEKIAAALNIEEEKVLKINELILERKMWLLKSAVVMETAS